MGAKEAVVEQHLVKRVKDAGGIAFKFTSPGRRGVPDRLVVLPNMILFVECKAEGGTLTTGQRKEHQRLQNLGMTVATVYSRSDVNDLMTVIYEAIEMRKDFEI